jgi:protein-tyrosine phosphatase
MEENYLKLLEYEQELEKTGEYLSLEKEKELINYQIQISDHFRWEQKNNFSEAIVDFLEENKTIIRSDIIYHPLLLF